MREHGGEPGRQIAEEAQALLDTYQTLRNGQLQAIGSAKGSSTDSGEKRRVLAVQLHKNLLTLLLHAQNPPAAEKYFDVSFLKKVWKEEVRQEPLFCNQQTHKSLYDKAWNQYVKFGTESMGQQHCGNRKG